jgi:hypothetical protein
LFDAPEENLVRIICAKYSIAVFSLVSFDATPAAFGTVYFSFTHEGTPITVYTKLDKAKDAFETYRLAGFPISYINNSAHPIADSDVSRVVTKLQADYKDAHDPKKHEKKGNYFDQLTKIVLKKESSELE